MEIGRSSPRHEELSRLYARSHSLQSYINEYFIVAVEFCHQMLLFTRKSGLRQFTTALSGSFIKKTQSDMDDWGGRIKEEMLLLMAKRTEDEAAENSRSRSIMSQFSKSASHHNKLATKLRILKECSTYDHETTWKQIRKSGNTTSFTESDDYKKWMAQSQSCTLLYYGKLGCGKSVSLSNMVDDLNLVVGQHRTSVAYFFVRHDLPESLKGRTVIGTLVRQLLVSLGDLRDATNADTGVLNIGDMLSLLLRNYNKQHKIYLVLDGLDLCKKEEIELVVGFVKELQEQLWVLACVSLRQEPDRQPDAVYRGFRTLQISSLPDNNSDITSFIDTELARCVEDGNLKLGNAALILTIRDTLSRDSKGMFLWVALQIKVLCSMETDREIKETLADLPTDLSDIYFRILGRVQGRRKLHQDRILRLIAAAKHPLTTDEMRDALSVTPGETDWINRDTVNDIYSTLSTCGCLIGVDEEELTVRFVHPSVEEFLLRPGTHHGASKGVAEPQNDTGLTKEGCHRTIAEIIVTYLSFGVFDTRISNSRVPMIEVGDTPSKVVEAATGGSRTVQRLALKLLAHGKRPDFDLGKAIAKELATQEPQDRDQFPFLNYAKNWCLHHLCAIKSEAPGGLILDWLPNIMDVSGYSILSGATLTTTIPMAIEHDSMWLLRRLVLISHPVLYGEFQYECQGVPTSYTPFAFALCTGKENTLTALDLGSAIHLSAFDAQPICYAIYRGDSIKVRRYLKQTDGDHHVCRSGRNLIAFAIWRGQMDMVQWMVEEGLVDVNTGSPNHTPIREAVTTQNLEALIILLNCGRLRLSYDEREALWTEAEATGFEEGVQLMIDDLNRRNRKFLKKSSRVSLSENPPVLKGYIAPRGNGSA
jgi:hypothetical protein